jgi:hypothetical protein
MDFVQQLNLRPADRIVAPLFRTGLTKHHAIFLGVNDYGQRLIAENDATDGVRIVTVEQFFSEHPVIDRVERFQGNYIQRNQAVMTAQNLVGTHYDLFLYNCEHYANEVQHGIVESNQVKNFWKALGIVAFVYVLVKN